MSASSMVKSGSIYTGQNQLVFHKPEVRDAVNSFHITTIYASIETPIGYQNHLESVYCIEGKGEIETVDDGKIYPIKQGTLYILNKHDKHLLRAKTQLKLACVFNPPLHGKEVHDGIGGYPLEAEEITD